MCKGIAEIEERKILAEKQAAKELTEIEERKLVTAKEAAEAERQRLELEKANQLKLMEWQAALSVSDKQGDYELKVNSMADEKEKLIRQYEHENIQSQKEFDSILEQAKLETETKIQMCQIESTI